MTTMQEWLCYLAYAVAVVLVAIGVRRIVTQARLHRWADGRQGVFLTALGFFLMFSGSGFAQDTSSSSSDNATSKTITSGKTASDVKTTSAKGVAAVAALPIPPELAKEGKWEAFKAFWKKLDAIEPKKPIPPKDASKDINKETDKKTPFKEMDPFGQNPKIASEENTAKAVEKKASEKRENASGSSENATTDTSKDSAVVTLHDADIEIATSRMLVPLTRMSRMAPRFPEVRFDKRPYFQAISANQASALLRELALLFDQDAIAKEFKTPVDERTFGGLKMRLDSLQISRQLQQAKASSMSIMLTQLAEQRIRAMATSSAQPMYTRMMAIRTDAETPLFATFDTLDRLEARIDTLMELRAKKVLTEESVAASLRSIEEQAYLALMLTAFSDSGFWMTSFHDAIKRTVSKTRMDFSTSAETPWVWENTIDVYQRQERQRLEKLDERQSSSSAHQQEAVSQERNAQRIAKPHANKEKPAASLSKGTIDQITYLDKSCTKLREKLAMLKAERDAFRKLINGLEAE